MQAPEDTVTALRIKAHQHFRRGEWAVAEALYAELAQMRPHYAYLRRRAMWCLRHAERFTAEHLTPAHRDRVLAAVRAAYPQTAIVQSRHGPGGLNSIRNFRHLLLDAGGATLGEVFEKSYLGTEAKGFARARLLFESHPAEALMAPRYHGSVEAGPFRSILLDRVAGDKPGPAEWPDVQRRIVAALWQRPPGPGVRVRLSHTRIRNLLERLHAPGVLVNTTAWWPAGSVGEWFRIAAGQGYPDMIGAHVPRGLRERLRRGRPAIAERLRRLPLFVMHADLHQGNVFMDRAAGRVWVIDWDRWTAEPVGAGMPVDLSAGTPPLPEEALRQGRFAAAPPDPADAALAALLWDLRASFEAGAFTRLEPLAEHIVRRAGG